MGFDVVEAVTEGFSVALSRVGLLVMGAFFVVETVNVLLYLAAGSMYMPLDAPAGPLTPSTLPAGTELPGPTAVAAILVSGVFGTFVSVPVSIIAIRTFVAGARERIPDVCMFHRIGRATLSGVTATFLLMVLFFSLPAVGVGLAIGFAIALDGLVVIVGVILLVVLLVGVLVMVWLHFLFLLHEIAVRDVGALTAFRGSWVTARRSRLRLFALAVVLVLVRMSVGYAVTPRFDGPLAVLDLGMLALSLVLSAMIGTIVVAVFARSYRQLSPDPTVREWSTSIPTPAND